jgi:hypothetical protein
MISSKPEDSAGTSAGAVSASAADECVAAAPAHSIAIASRKVSFCVWLELLDIKKSPG